jgi:transcriptional regulator with XRE-family HTH domain
VATIGDRIKEVREKRERTQDWLAREARISKGFLSEIENNKGTGNIGADFVVRISNALGVSLDYLLLGEVATQDAAREPVTIPRSLSEAAEQLSLTYAETMTLLEAHHAVVARRSARTLREPTTDEWKELWKAIRQAYPDAPDAEN